MNPQLQYFTYNSTLVSYIYDEKHDITTFWLDIINPNKSECDDRETILHTDYICGLFDDPESTITSHIQWMERIKTIALEGKRLPSKSSLCD